MAKLDAIYGTDDNSLADSVASDALNPAHQTPQAAIFLARDSRAKSEGGVTGERSFSDADITYTNRGEGNDKRADSKGNQ